MKHILFQNGLVYKRRREIKAPENYEYNYSVGAWMHCIDKEYLVASKDFKALGTKKYDVETGEDSKGE